MKRRLRMSCHRSSPLGFSLAVSVAVATAGVPHAAGAQATTEPSISIEELMSIADVTHYRVSDDNDVAWVEREREAWNVFVARAPGYSTKRLTSFGEDDGDDLSIVGFGPEGEVIFLRGVPGMNPSHRPDPTKVRLYSALEDRGVPRFLLDGGSFGFGAPIISPDKRVLAFSRGGEVHTYQLGVTDQPTSRLFTERGAIASLAFSPDGHRLAFVSNRSVFDRGKYTFVGVYDLDAHKITYMAPGLGIDQNVVWSPDGQRLAFVRVGFEPRTWRFTNHREGSPFSIVVADATTGEGNEVFTAEVGYGSQFNGLSASGYWGLGGQNSLIWLANDELLFPYEKSGWKQLYAVSANGGPARQVTSGAFELAGAYPVPGRTQVLYWANSEQDLTRLGLFRIDLATNLRSERLEIGSKADMPFTAVPFDNGGFAYDAAGGQAPERLMIKTRDGVDIQVSTGPTPDDPITKKLPAPETVTFRSLDGTSIPAILYKPTQSLGTGAHPVLVHAHGGSRYQVYPVWMASFGFPKVMQYFAGMGYYVLTVNYRSGTGYGLDFREPESYGGRGAGDVDDFLAAADYLVETYPEIDPDRLVIYGHSYGGHIVTNALARSDKYAAGISSAGVGDWVVEMEKDFGEVLQFNIPERLELEALAHQSSAIWAIDNWGDEPILFLHGDNDGSAAMQQTLELYLALRRRGKTAEAVIFPGESHSLRLFSNQLKYLRAIAEFVERHVGGDVPVPDVSR